MMNRDTKIKLNILSLIEHLIRVSPLGIFEKYEDFGSGDVLAANVFLAINPRPPCRCGVVDCFSVEISNAAPSQVAELGIHYPV